MLTLLSYSIPTSTNISQTSLFATKKIDIRRKQNLKQSNNIILILKIITYF